jgi:hypothetical protein
VDARTTAGLETGAKFRPLHNHAVTVPGYLPLEGKDYRHEVT